jgi:hypothetical protein
MQHSTDRIAVEPLGTAPGSVEGNVHVKQIERKPECGGFGLFSIFSPEYPRAIHLQMGYKSRELVAGKGRCTRMSKSFQRFFLVLFGAILVLGSGAQLLEGNAGIRTVVVLLSGLIFLYAFYYMGRSEHAQVRPEVFLQGLLQNKNAITNGGWNYQGMLVTPGTEVTQFFFAYSVVIMSARIPSRFYVIGQENTALMNAFYSSATFLCGWWGVPWGPIYTVQSLYWNVRGGNRLRVGDLIQDQQGAGAEVLALRAQAPAAARRS